MAYLRNFSLTGGPPPPYFGNISKKNANFFECFHEKKYWRFCKLQKISANFAQCQLEKPADPILRLLFGIVLQTHKQFFCKPIVLWGCQNCIDVFFLSHQDLNLFLIPPEWKGRKNMCLSQAIRKGKKTNLSPRSLLNI